MNDLVDLFPLSFGESVGRAGGGGGQDEPLLKAAEFPFGKVLLINGPATEKPGHDGMDFGQGIEPLEEPGIRLLIEEALVELFADGLGEAGDFAVAWFHGR